MITPPTAGPSVFFGLLASAGFWVLGRKWLNWAFPPRRTTAHDARLAAVMAAAREGGRF